MIYCDDGSSAMLTASGVVRFDVDQTREMSELLDLVREQRRGSPELVLNWLRASGQPRALAPVIESRLRDLGFEPGCPICASPHRDSVERRHVSIFALRNRFGIEASWRQVREHCAHARRRAAQPHA